MKINPNLVYDVLYENSSGTIATTVTLNKDVSNYTTIAITYARGLIQYIDVLTTNGKNVLIPLSNFWNDGTSASGVFGAFYKLNGTQLVYQYSRRFYFYTHESKPTVDTNATIPIYKIVGYK